MKKLFSVGQTSSTTDAALLIARIGIAGLMLTHGFPKLVMLLSGAPVQFPAVFGLSAELSLTISVFAEVFCSFFLLIGLATRLAVIPLATTMLVAVFVIHAADPLAVKEPAMLYALAYIVLLVAGSGKYSFDYMLQRKKATLTYTERKVEDPTLAIYQ